MNIDLLRSPLAHLVLAGCLATTACGGGPEDVGSTAQASWVLSYSSDLHSWSTSKGSPSELQEVSCRASTDDRVMTGLKAWREPKKNLDNFIARLSVRCSRITEQDLLGYLSYADQSWSLLYSHLYDPERRGSTTTSSMPIGVRLSFNAGGTYVKDVEMVRGSIDYGRRPRLIAGYGDSIGTGWALDNGSHSHHALLQCEEQKVIDSVGVRYDLRNGKIRTFQINCSPVYDL